MVGGAVRLLFFFAATSFTCAAGLKSAHPPST